MIFNSAEYRIPLEEAFTGEQAWSPTQQVSELRAENADRRNSQEVADYRF